MKRACPVAPSSIVRLVSAFAIALVAASGSAQQTQQAGAERPGSPAVTLPIGPVVYHTADGVRVRMVILTRGLSHPWGLAFLPDGRMVVRTGHLERIAFNRRGEEQRREWLLADLKQRIRDVRQGPDGLLYVLTEEDDAALLRIEPDEVS